jgi:hypothetical protein
MKKRFNQYKNTGLSALLALILFSACKKEELRSKELVVYMQGDKSSLTKSTVMPFVHTPLSVEGNTTKELYIYATREVAADIMITVGADLSAVDAYNAQNGTKFLPMPATAFRIVSSGPYTIPAGATRSATPIQIEITDAAALNDPKGYILPVGITKVESKDKGVQTSTTHRLVFVNVTYEFNNIQRNQTASASTPLARTGWSVTVSNTTSGAPATNLLDGSNSTVWRSSNSSTAAKWVIVNMGSAQTVNGFVISPNYTSTSENATSMLIATSNDNVTWTEQGRWTGTGPATGTSAAAPDFKGVNFIAPVTAQYVRFTITAQTSTSRVGMAEINAIP